MTPTSPASSRTSSSRRRESTPPSRSCRESRPCPDRTPHLTDDARACPACANICSMELGLNKAAPATMVVDLNCAFASIEQQHDPTLRGRPLAIAAYATDAATIVSASREARDLGIRTGMKVFEAKAIFSAIAIKEPNPPLYRTVSDKLVEVMRRHSPDVLRMSIDEASLNLTGTPDLVRRGPEGVGRAIKAALRREAGECITCSVGISTSIWMAKQASNLNKRDGMERIDHTNLVSVFGRLGLTDLSGIAEASARRLLRAGIHTPLEFLSANTDRLRLAEMVGRRLRAAGRRGRVVSISVVYRPDTDRFSRQSTLGTPIATGEEIYRAALALLAGRDTRRAVGTLGVGLAGLTDPNDDQLDLFTSVARPRPERLEAAMDAIRDRFGEDAVQRARLLGRAPVVRDRIAFGNTGHPDDESRPDG